MFYSQFGEDKILADIFAGKDRGVCVEVGANNGVWGSTTLHFEERGWECVLVEPNPSLCRDLRVRRQAQVFECAASNRSGTATLQIAAGAELAHGVSTLGGEDEARDIARRHGFTTQSVEVQTRTLDDILEAAKLGPSIDFISIDVEGHELEVLAGFFVERWRPTVLILEDNSLFSDRAVSGRLRRAGYVRFMRTGVNDWYAHHSNARLASRARRLGYYPSMLLARLGMLGGGIRGTLGRIPLLRGLRERLRQRSD